jgi:hypothetical protein
LNGILVTHEAIKMAKQKIKREEIASCPVCQEQISFKVDLELDVPENVSVLGASLQIPLVHKECALKERERGMDMASRQRR